MNIFLTICRYEWLKMRREKILLYTLFFFLVISLLAVRSGNQAVHNRWQHTDSLQRVYTNDFYTVLKKFTDTSSETAKQQAAYAGLAEVINHRLPQYAVKKPAPLAALSLGASDVQPWHIKIQTSVNYSSSPEPPVANPVLLFAGNFDFAFVMVYLLPLLVIVFFYAVYADENEAGTVGLLHIQGTGIMRIVLAKFIFRGMLLCICMSVMAALAAGMAERRNPVEVAAIWKLFAVIAGYLLLWTLVAFVVVTRRRTATVTGIWLITVWIMVIIVWPSLANTYALHKYPLQMRDDLSSYERHQSEQIWNMETATLVDSFVVNNPEYGQLIAGIRSDAFLKKKFTPGYYDLLERRVSRAAEQLQRDVDSRNQLLNSLTAWNPAMCAQETLNELAETDFNSYRQFHNEAMQFQKKWRDFLYGFQLQNKMLTPQDLHHVPVFDHHKTLR